MKATTTDRTISRRRMLQTTALLAAGGAAAGTASPVAAQSDEGTDLSEWFANVSNVDGVVDETGTDEVRVTVGASGNNGAFAFDPPALRVSPGTKVVWEWTGEGGDHNVVAEAGTFESDLVGDEGATFEHTFEEAAIHRYVCVPHEAMGMKGAVIVGDAEVTLGSSEEGGSGNGADGSDGDTEARTYLNREPQYDGWFDDVDNYEGTVDMRGREEVRIRVGAEGNGGGLAFDPPAVAVDAGTRVVWEWTGDDGPHQFAAADESFSSPEQSEGEWGLVFDGVGISQYECLPHADAGMRGAVVVGDVYEGVYDVSTSHLTLVGSLGAAFLSPLAFGAFLWARGEDGTDENHEGH